MFLKWRFPGSASCYSAKNGLRAIGLWLLLDSFWSSSSSLSSSIPLFPPLHPQLIWSNSSCLVKLKREEPVLSPSSFPCFQYLKLLVLKKIEKLCNFAVCLDGSLPGYHFDKGSGSGSNSWLLHLQVFLFLVDFIFTCNIFE